MHATKNLANCFIGRFGWVGDRVSLEDQVANAAFVEMNMTTTRRLQLALYTQGRRVVPDPVPEAQLRPGQQDVPSNRRATRDLTERDIERMADYARWLGNPTRSEFKVALPEVIAGEKIFRELRLRHVSRDQEDRHRLRTNTMLTVDYRDRLAKRVKTQRRHAQSSLRSCPTSAPIC